MSHLFCERSVLSRYNPVIVLKLDLKNTLMVNKKDYCLNIDEKMEWVLYHLSEIMNANAMSRLARGSITHS